MVRALVWIVFCVPLTAALLAATPALGDISQSGSVLINSSQILVGTNQVQPASDGVLTVTPPSTLTTSSMQVGAGTSPPYYPTGQVFVTGGVVNVSQQARIGDTTRGSLHVSQGGIFDARELIVGGLTGVVTAPAGGSERWGEGTVVATGPGSKIRPQTLVVGDYGVGSVSIQNGALLGPQSQSTGSQDMATIARRAGSIGSVIIDGAGSTWQQQGMIVVGGSGEGRLDILRGGVVNSRTGVVGQGLESGLGQGAVRIDGRGSRWSTRSLVIGDRSFGEVRVDNGGTLDVGQGEGVRLGSQFGSFGRLVVSGRDTLLQNDSGLTINSGEFILEGGAVVTGSTRNRTTIGTTGGQGLAVVRGEGTRWQVAAPSIGTQVAAGELRIEDGGTVTLIANSGPLNIGKAGRLTLDGGVLSSAIPRVDNPQLLNSGLVEGSGRIAVGYLLNANGTIRVNPGDHLTVGSSLGSLQGGVIEVTDGELEVDGYISTYQSTTAVNLDNGTVRMRGLPAFNSGPASFLNGGPLTFTGGASRMYGRMDNEGSIRLLAGSRALFYDSVANRNLMSAGPNATVTILGALSGNGISGPGEAFLEGGASPGFSVGTMDFGGDVSLGNAGTLSMDVVDDSAGFFDQLTSVGKVTLGGTLGLTALAPLENAASLEIITAGELLGQFDAVPELGSTIGMGVRFNGVTYDYNHDRVLVSLLPTLEGDFNIDGEADGADLLAWQQGNMEDPAAAAALAVWTNAVSPASTGQAATVPEPGAAILLLLGGLGGRRIVRRRL